MNNTCLFPLGFILGLSLLLGGCPTAVSSRAVAPATKKPKPTVIFTSVARGEPGTHAVSSISLGDPLYIYFDGRVRCDRGFDAVARLNGTTHWFLHEVRPSASASGSLTGVKGNGFTSSTTFTGERGTTLRNHGLLAVRQFNATVIPALREGPNQVEVTIHSSCGRNSVLAKGRLTVNVSPGAVTTYLDNFGTRFKPSPHPDNEQLVAQLSKIDFGHDGEFVGARVLSESSTTVRHRQSGVVTGQQFAAAVVLRKKGENYCRLYHAMYHSDAADKHITFSRLLSESRRFAQPTLARNYGKIACADAPTRP